jgi:hypothetical protein
MAGYSRVLGDLGHRERSPLYLSLLGKRLRVRLGMFIVFLPAVVDAL